jgi:hypothetical protein
MPLKGCRAPRRLEDPYWIPLYLNPGSKSGLSPSPSPNTLLPFLQGKTEQLESKAVALVVTMTTTLDYFDPTRARVRVRWVTVSGAIGSIRLQGVGVVIIIGWRWGCTLSCGMLA